MVGATSPKEIPEPSPPEIVDEPESLDALERGEDYLEVRVDAVDLSGVDASHAHLTRSEFIGTTLTAATLRAVNLVDVRFTDCELSGADLHDASLHRVEFRNCRMVGVTLSEAELRHVRFVDCKLDDANLRLARLDHVRSDGCSMVEADAYEASLTAVRFDTSDLSRADLSKVVVTGLDVRGSTIDALRGAGTLRNIRIGADQVIPFAASVFAETGVRID